MSTTADAESPLAAELMTPLSLLQISRARALWRLATWTLLPDMLTARPGETQLPSASDAGILAMLRVLHSEAAAPVGEQQVAARKHLGELLSQGPTEPQQPGTPPSRLDLAASLLQLPADARLLLELIAVTQCDPETGHAARQLAGRLGRSGSLDLDLLDDALGLAGAGVGLAHHLCGPSGELRRSGAVMAGPDARSVALTPVLVRFLDRLEARSGRFDDAELINEVPAAALAQLRSLRQPFIAAVAKASELGRPLLLSGLSGFGAAAYAELVAAQRGLQARLWHTDALWNTAAEALADDLPQWLASVRLSPQLCGLTGVQRWETWWREHPAGLLRLLRALGTLERPLLLWHEGPVAPDLAAALAWHCGAQHLEIPPLQTPERSALLATLLSAGGVEPVQAAQLADHGSAYALGVERLAWTVAHAMQRAQGRAAAAVIQGAEVQEVAPTPAEVRRAASVATTHKMRAYGSRVETLATWGDLVLEAETLDAVKNIARYARVRDRLFGEWGFDRKMTTGRAISAMFSGPSGTGKTMVAGLIARDLGVELYRVDLSRVVSKYIGETEERLGALFDEAAQIGAALLFDEADSMFGQRTEIHSSNDRYANLEVNYLLQRLEEFDGMVFLTTNFGSSIDEAFLRRLRFRVQFPFPGPAERGKMWDTMLPVELPTDEEYGLDLEWMGKTFELTGGHIRNALLRAAMLAAEADRPVGQRMLYDAAAAEYKELGKLAPAYPFED